MTASTADAPATLRSRQRVAEIVTQQEQKAARVRLVRRLASALLHLLQISPEGAELVVWLSDDDCHCNAKAVRAWIRAQLEDPELARTTSNPQVLVAALGHRLQRCLFAIEDTLA